MSKEAIFVTNKEEKWPISLGLAASTQRQQFITKNYQRYYKFPGLCKINYNNKMKEISSLPSRKPITCKFSSAKPCRFFTNYYTIGINESKSMLYQYLYIITPEIQSDSSHKLQSIIRNIWKQLVEKIGLISIRGNNLYGSKNMDKQQKTFISQYHEQETITKYEVLIKKIKNLPLIEMLHSNRDNQVKIALQVLNIDTKERLKKMNMIELDQGRYYSINKDISENLSKGFYILKGYSFTAQKLKIGLCLHVQIFSRLIRQSNVLEQITNKSVDHVRESLVNTIVLTRYGNFRTYKIVDVCYDKTPLTRFVPANQQKQTTFIEYFKHNYDVNIEIKNQPLLKVITKIQKKKRKGGVTQKVIHEGYLVPELVSIVGFSQQHIKNPLLMKQISLKTQISVDNRVKQYDRKIEELNKIDGLYKIQNVKMVDGFQLEQPLIQLRKTSRAKNGQIRIEKQIIRQPAQFKNWLFITHENYSKEAHQLNKVLKIAAEGYGITLQKSEFFLMQGHGAGKWKECLQEQFEYYKQNKKEMPQIVMVLIGGSLKDQIYEEIKNICLTYQICSQFAIVNKISSLNQKNHLLSYASSLILQMNSKIGKPIWEVPVQNKILSKRIIGIAAIAMSKNNAKCSLGFVGTINQKLSKVYNQTISRKNFNQFDIKCLSPIFANWLKCFFQFNNKKILPEIIVFYREGLNSTQATKNIQIQIDSFKLAIEQAKKRTKMTFYNPQIVYMSVNKRSSTRFYEKFVGNAQKFTPKYMNPLSGSVLVDNLAADNVLNFHLSSCTSKESTTSSPTQVVFHYHQPKRTLPEAFIELTFQQSFNYYNWKGAIKPPACLQNADRLAKLASKTFKENITSDNALSKTYHFL